ncbi:hypothetical protein QPK24_09665 [Paenibacillus polygoni]|uniref:DUF5666 domain-containing protein n=1 Tax=Paenibacillus polygoni TaxID=3050112 RepID=A0ABY8X792_9BACL|nr:hypothetical protein [Paenibacillus polygoni]WIV20913.1 hypothetical protein QPK24_09665 [Paenibacillus polygoni]
MKRKKSSILASLSLASVLVLTLLSGCGSTTDDAESNPAAVTEANPSTSANTNESETQGTLLLGKVKSIEGSTLTIYTSPTQPREGNGGNPPARKAPQGEAPQGEASQGEVPAAGSGPGTTPPQQGEAPEGTVPDMPADGAAPPSMDNLFTDETMEITITDSTTMPSTSVQADDIVNITLEEGTQNAISIQVHNGLGGPAQNGAVNTPTETETP